MAAKPIKKSVLLKTSVATDVQYSGNTIAIAGLNSVSKRNLIAIRQVKAKAEVVQIATVSTTAVPTASTTYKVFVYDPLRVQAGFQESQKPYSYTTSATLVLEGATAALQREFINGKIITQINADSGNNHATAVTSAGGTGFTITDAGGYYPVFAQSMTNIRGANTVLAGPNSDGTGFATTVVSITTPAIYSFGLGANLASEKPVIDAVFGGNVISGTIDDAPVTNANPPLPAVSGQNYDAFVIEDFHLVDAIGVTGQWALVERVQRVFVDNGTGSATTNATGFIAFQREMYRALFGVFKNDPIAQVDFFDSALTASATYPTTGAAVTTTDNVVMSATSAGNEWYINPIGTHTLITPIVTTAGLIAQLDITTQEGLELSPANLTQCPKQFVVGKTEASFYARVTFTGIAATDWKTLSVGFRKKAAYAVDQTAYEAVSVATAALGVPLDTGVAPIVNIITGPGTAGALTNTSTVVAPSAGASVDLLVTVDINGLTRFYVNGVEKTGLLAANYTFTAALNLMPFISFRNGAGTAASPAIVQTAFVPSIQWFS